MPLFGHFWCIFGHFVPVFSQFVPLFGHFISVFSHFAYFWSFFALITSAKMPLLSYRDLIEKDQNVRLKYVWVKSSADSAWCVKMMLVKVFNGDIINYSDWFWIIPEVFWSQTGGQGSSTYFNPLLRHWVLVINSCSVQAAALKQLKRSLFKGKTDSDPCFWQRTKGLSVGQVTAMWHCGI